MKFSRLIRRKTAVALVALFWSCSSSEDVGGPRGTSDDDTTIVVTPGDTVGPVAITGLAVTYDRTTDEATISWTAPHDDSLQERATRYEIRRSLTRGAPPADFWRFSAIVSDPPLPEDPGTQQQFILNNLPLARDLYVGVRSFDENDNPSPNSDIVMVHLPGPSFRGKCIDAVDGQPIEGIQVKLTSTNVIDFVTDENGEFFQDEVEAGGATLTLLSGPTTALYHRVTQLIEIPDDTSHTFVMIPHEITAAPELGGATMLALLTTVTQTAHTPHIIPRWYADPIPVYIPPFINTNGVNYDSLMAGAVQRWNDRTERSIFSFATEPPEEGISVLFRSREAMNGGNGLATWTFDDDRQIIDTKIQIIDDFGLDRLDRLFSIMLHELGHAIGLFHLSDRAFIMFAGQPLPLDISDDEARAVQMLHRIEPVTFMTIYSANLFKTATGSSATNKPTPRQHTFVCD